MTQTTNTKPKPRKVRGTGTYVGDEFTFTPYEQGEPTQRNVKTTKGGKVYETCSEKKPMKVAYLTCAADAADPWSEYTSQLKKLGVKPQKPQQLPDSLRVVAEQGLECWLDEEKTEMTFTGKIDLSRHSRDWQAEVLKQVQLIVRRLPASERFNKVINSIKNKSLEK
ncbi:MAG: hypothetical protein IKO17_00745 [Prevotella sp.]|nr:hypothetical protein [Prevotella sp.]